MQKETKIPYFLCEQLPVQCITPTSTEPAHAMTMPACYVHKMPMSSARTKSCSCLIISSSVDQTNNATIHGILRIEVNNRRI